MRLPSSHWLLFPVIAALASSCAIMKAPTLEKAVQYRNEGEVRRHLNEGADVNQPDENGFTPLHHAARKGYKVIAEILIERGANVNAEDNKKRTPLHIAAREGYDTVVDLLIAKGANVPAADKAGRTALHHAALGTGQKGAMILLKHGASVDVKDIRGNTPLYLACLGNQPEMVELLINSGAEINPILSVREADGQIVTRPGPSPIIAATREGNLKVVQVLLDKGAPVQGPRGAAKTPLHIAAEKGTLDIAKLLVQREADLNDTDAQKKVPIYYATYNDHVDIMKLLIEAGVDANQKIEEGSLLHVAAERGNRKATKLLVEKYVDLDVKNSRDKKALDVAIDNGHQWVAEFLTKESVRRRKVGE